LERLLGSGSPEGRRLDAMVPVDDLAVFRLLAAEIARTAVRHGGDGLALVVDAQTSARIDLVDQTRMAAAQVFHYGEPPLEWGHADNVLVVSAAGQFEEDDRILLAVSSTIAFAVLGTRNAGVDFGADSFTGAWTAHRESVLELLELLPECSLQPPSPRPGGAPELVRSTMQLTAIQANVLASRQRDISMDKDDLSSVLDILKAMSAKRSSHDILYVFVENIARVVSSERCSIVRVWGGKQTGQVLASHEDANLSNREIDLEKYPELQHVLHSGEQIVINDVYAHPMTRPCEPFFRRTRIRSLLVIPIVLHDRNVGSLFLRAARSQGSFTLREISFFEIVAEAAANALERAELFESVQKANERLEYLAVTDGLTGLFNHRCFRERLEEEVQRALRYQSELSCMIFDVDNFKSINDTHGHLEGDHILSEIGERTRRSVRRSDLVARYGGEEFVVIMPQTGPEGAFAQAERIRQEIAGTPFVVVNGNIPVTISAGVAVFDHEGRMDAEGLILKADRALYRAKAAGKNRTILAG
jgi:diguanylate cyclase (GGDEF)-like protein